MPLVIPNTTSAADYAPFGGSGNYTSGFVNITGASLSLLRLYYGIQGSGQVSDDIPLAPGTYPLSGTKSQPIAGLAVKDFQSGMHVQYSGALFGPWEAAVVAGAPASSSVTANGTVIPNVANINGITGRATTTGVVQQGSGYTLSVNGPGDVTIMFTSPFAAPPIVIASPLAFLGYIDVGGPGGAGIGACRIQMYDTTATPAAGSFYFAAIAAQ